MTRDEALRACMTRNGWSAADCAPVVDDRFVDGTYCDGTIVMTESGTRCVSREVIDRKHAAAPLVRAPEPSPSPGPWAVPLTLSLSFRLLCALSDMWTDR